MNDELKKSMYRVAAGEISEPSIDIVIDDRCHTFLGKDAKIFAFGVLSGLRAAEDGCDTQINIAKELYEYKDYSPL